MSKMTPQVYQEQRDQLVQVLNSSVKIISDLSVKHEVINTPEIKRRCAELRHICAKVYEDQFKIALVAKFQGGKSTTFNAMAMGRPCSPMGDGSIKTSACVVRMWNVTDPKQEGVTVIWRTDEELLLSVMDLLRNQYVRLDPERCNGRTAAELAGMTQLAETKDRDLFVKAVQAEVGVYIANKQGYVASDCTVHGGKVAISGVDKINILFIAAVIARFYGNSVIEATKTRTFSSKEVGAILRFPEDMTVRMLDFFNGKDVFKPSELAFAFIKEAQIRTVSSNLARIGAAITDCPGLSASAYDTTVAMDIIAESDAVWYLLDGRAIGAAELEDIANSCKAAAGKIFFTVNLKSDANPSRAHIVDKIIPHQQKQLQQQGIDVTLNPYHALLAYLTFCGEDLLADQATEETKNELIRRARDLGNSAETCEDAWSMIAEDMLYRLKVPERPVFQALSNKLCAEGLALLRKASELDNILAQVEGYVVQHKAASILLDGGVNKAVSTIEDGIEKVLKAREENAGKIVDELKRKYERMELRVKQFSKDSAIILRNLEDIGVDRNLAADFLDTVMTPSLQETARLAAPVIRSKMDYWKSLLEVIGKGWSSLSGQPENHEQSCAEKEVEAILKQALDAASEVRCCEWSEKLKTGRNESFNQFLHIVNDCRKRIQRDWEQMTTEFPDLKSLPTPTSVFPSSADLSPKVLKDQLQDIALRDDGMDTVIAGGTAFAVFGTIALFVPGIGPIFTVACAAVCILLWKLFKNEDELVAKMTEQISETLDDSFREQREMMISGLAPEMSKLRNSYRLLFTTGFKQQDDALNKQKEQAFSDLEKGEVERKQIEAECRDIRTGFIIPLRKELEQYRDQLIPLL
jgi:hypothetical protein